LKWYVAERARVTDTNIGLMAKKGLANVDG